MVIVTDRPRENDGTEREAQGVGRDVMSTKVIFRRTEVSFFWRKSVFRDVRMQSCLALRFLVTLRLPLHEIFTFLSNIRLRLACMRTSRKTDFR